MIILAKDFIIPILNGPQTFMHITLSLNNRRYVPIAHIHDYTVYEYGLWKCAYHDFCYLTGGVM